jgi:sulfofructose kinase
VPRYDPDLMAAPAEAPDLTGFAAVMTDVRWPGAAALALEAARKAGIPAILDADMAAGDILHRLVPLATHIVASESAAKLITGEVSPEAAARALLGRSDFVAVTAGGDGCWWSERGTIHHTPAPRIEAIDTLAAGDVFHAAFALKVVEGAAMAATIAFASAAAAIKCTRFGGRLGCPSRDEVEAFVAREAVGA